jgi:probable rRNA maturation factor
MVKKLVSPIVLSLDIQFGSDALKNKWKPILSTRKIRQWVQAGVKQSATLTIRLVGAAEGRKLNREFRNKDYATNILTFNYPTESDEIFSDLVICMPVLIKEAREQGKSTLDHFIHLLIHGLLHAQGFDHEDTIEAEAMEALEINILNKLGLENPYLSQR